MHDEQAELTDRRRVLDEEDGADDFAADLGDPASLAPRVEALDELRDDARDERLEALVPAELLRVERAVQVHDGAHVSGLMGTEEVGRLSLLAGLEQRLDRAHRLDEAVLIRGRERGEEDTHILVRARVGRSEALAALHGQLEMTAATVGLRAGFPEQAAFFEAPGGPAQVPGIGF